MGNDEIGQHVTLIKTATLEEMDDILTELLIVSYPTLRTQKN